MSKPTRERALFFITTISCGHVMFVKVFSSVYEKKLRLFVVARFHVKQEIQLKLTCKNLFSALILNINNCVIFIGLFFPQKPSQKIAMMFGKSKYIPVSYYNPEDSICPWIDLYSLSFLLFPLILHAFKKHHIQLQCKKQIFLVRQQLFKLHRAWKNIPSLV